MNVKKAIVILNGLIKEEESKEDWDGVILAYAREAIIALEAEKPTNDAIERSKQAFNKIINQDHGTWDKPVSFSVLHTRSVDIARDALSEIEDESVYYKPVDVKKELPSCDNGYIDALVIVWVKNKNKEDGIYLPDLSAFDGEKWSERHNTWEDIVLWQPLPEEPRS